MAIKNTSDNEAAKVQNNIFLFTGNKGPRFGKRHIQILLTAFGTGIMFSTKAVLSLLLVAMTKKQESSNDENIPVYQWTNTGVIISSILWTSMFFQLFSGHVGKEYGAKWLILGAASINTAAFLLIPTAAAIGGSTGVIICRLWQGVAQGSYTPLTACIGGAWIPAEERSRMGYIGTIGITSSIILATILTGIIANSSIGWPGAIYLFGGINGLWCICWFFFGCNRPAIHSSITPEEKEYIQTSLKQEELGRVPTPWLKIFTSICVWGIIVSQIGSNFILTMLSTENAIFVANVMKFDVEKNAVISALPTFLSCACGVALAFLSDFLITRKILRVVNARRTFQLIGVTGAGTSLILSSCIPVEYAYWVVPILCLESFFTMTCMVGGSDISGYDLSPMFASVIYGVAGTLSDAVGLFAPLLIQWLVHDDSNAAEWRLVFTITAVVGICPSIIFAIFASDKRQNWGDYHEESVDERRLSINSIRHGIGKV